MDENIERKEMIELTEAAVDKLKANRFKKVFVTLGISAAVVGSVAIAKALGLSGNELHTFAQGAMIGNGVMVSTVTMPALVKAFYGPSVGKQVLEELKEGKHEDLAKFKKNFLDQIIKFSGTTEEKLRQEIAEQKGRSL